MSLKPSLSPRTEQRLGMVLTPQMRQRIEMLSMNLLEVAELAAQELVSNPILEEVEGNEEPAGGLTVTDEGAGYDDVIGAGAPPPAVEPPAVEGTAPDAPPGDALSESSPETASGEEYDATGATTEDGVATDPFAEIDFGGAFENYLDPGYKTYEYEEREETSFENLLTRRATLTEHLQWQLNLSRIAPELRPAAEALINSLDDNGYLADSLEEVAAIGPWPVETVEKARTFVQGLDPIGVGSRSVTECFLVQLRHRGHGHRLAARLVSEYFDRLQQYRWPDLAKELGVGIEMIANEVALIQKLEPYPGRQFAKHEAHPIQPEVYIERIDDEYYIRFNDDGLPHLRINSTYRRILESRQASKEEREYIREHFRAAVDLLKNIDYRRHTIYRICEAIVERQRAFLDGGIQYLKPMMLKDVAEQIGIHLSTVSRVVNGKYAHTPLGVIELRRFFTEGMVNDQGEEVSTRLLKLRVKKLIEAEDPRDPLTDDEIMQRLAAEGIKMSRRTVAKYRDQMNILGSRERRVVI